jgi:hypothetical protein
MEGFERLSFVLRRRIDLESPDIELFDTIRAISMSGAIIWEGRVSALPRQLDADGHSLQIEAVGFMAAARDRKFAEVYVDGDLTAWEPPNLARQFALTAANFTIEPSTVVAGTGVTHTAALVLRITGNWVSPIKKVSEAMYTFPEGSSGFGYVYFWSLLSQAGGSWTHVFTTSDNGDSNTATVVETSGNFGGADTAGYWGPATVTNRGQRYVNATWYFNATPAGAASDEFTNSLRLLRVYGNTGLPFYGTDPKGFLVSDIIRDICRRWVPQLDPSGVQATEYPVQQAAWRERTDPYDAWLDLNRYHLWELAVWEGPTLHYGPIDASDYDWEVRLDDYGTTVDLQGDTTEELANGIVVEFDNPLTGSRDIVSPADYPELADTSADNPVNKHGLTVWTEKSLSSPATPDDAVQIGRAALAEFNQAKSPGTIGVTGHIRDRNGAFRPAFDVRAGDTVAITNHPNDRPRIVSETSWDGTSKTMRMAVDTTAKYLDAFLDRVATAITGAHG